MTEKVTVDDCRRAGHCAIGIRRWFEYRGLDFRDFLRNGIDVDIFLATGDAYAIRVVQLKREREGTRG